MEIADRLVVTRKLLGRRQRTQHLANFGQRAFDAGERVGIVAAVAVLVDAARQRADVVLDRFDRAPRHRLGDGVADLGQFAAEGRDRLLDMVRTLQRFDLARDLDQMTFQRGEIRAGRLNRGRRHRRSIGGRRRRRIRRHRCGAWRNRGCAARRPLPRRRVVEFILACGDFRDRGVERGGAEWRRGTIDFCRGALDGLGLVLAVVTRALALVLTGALGRRRAGGLRIRNLRQPRVEPRDRIAQLSRHRGLASRRVGARRLAARRRFRNLFDLPGDGVEPLVNVGDVAACLARHCRPLVIGQTKIRRRRIADSGVEPVVQRHAGAARRCLGPLPDGWIDAVNTPRYARIHDSVRFQLRRLALRLQPPRASRS